MASTVRRQTTAYPAAGSGTSKTTRQRPSGSGSTRCPVAGTPATRHVHRYACPLLGVVVDADRKPHAGDLHSPSRRRTGAPLVGVDVAVDVRVDVAIGI